MVLPPEPPFRTSLIPIIAENTSRDDARIEILECFHDFRFYGDPISSLPWSIGVIRKGIWVKAHPRFLFGVFRPFIHVGGMLPLAFAKERELPK